jgi:alpha-mannosidase
MPRPISDRISGETDRACIEASLARGMVYIGGRQIQEKELITRIIDKIPGAQFHKIIMAIKADLDMEYARAKRSAAAKESTSKRLYTLRKNKENS